MATDYINNQPVDIGDEKLNLIQAAFKTGVFILYYCWHPGLSVVASYRLCLVEIDERKPDGSTVMHPRVVPTCQTLARDGMVVLSNSAKASCYQAQTLKYPRESGVGKSLSAATSAESENKPRRL